MFKEVKYGSDDRVIVLQVFLSRRLNILKKIEEFGPQGEP